MEKHRGKESINEKLAKKNASKQLSPLISVSISISLPINILELIMERNRSARKRSANILYYLIRGLQAEGKL